MYKDKGTLSPSPSSSSSSSSSTTTSTTAKKQYDKNNINISDPDGRLKLLTEMAVVDIRPDVSPAKYYRSGAEMIRIAEQYKNQGEIQKAYVLYVKFIILFLEKIIKHPLYKNVSQDDKAKNKQTLKKIFPITEELKKKILQQYKEEAKKYIADEEQKKLKIDEENRRFKNLVNDDDKNNSNYKLLPHQNVDSFVHDKKFNLDDKETPVFDRSLKPASSQISSHRFSLSDLKLPSKLISEFLKLSNSNTLSNKETCGILTGKMGKNQLFVTHLLIPHQSGSPDSCLTHNEEDIFDYQDQHSLITLGWIHTHPTQTAFLSSVDLHTHCAYQLMLPEAIAVVCAPKYDETGFFMLTPEHGLDFIAHCRATGFHPHPNEKTLYTHATHCKLDSTMDIKIVDLRKNK
ncbi:hypothetical protein HCN44_007706 [Aphidius gifuensis]|uniref:MPN domain-containing protein n=2 Tax=Aphidius gifuensis TaxID=684658 RepID=A0A834XK16_APHGI|nr:hypothetical protein HCN44_007706 [Aphidius gifuensis]